MNTSGGISVTTIWDLVIGDEDSDGGNVIAGTAGDAISISGVTNYLQIYANRIGVGSDGSLIGNGGKGIAISNAQAVEIGKEDAQTGNVVSGSTGDGINLGAGTPFATVWNNTIGLDPGRTALRANTGSGIVVTSGAKGAALNQNVIAGNSGAGITIQAEDVTVHGNFIGTNTSGTSGLGNGNTGITVDDGDDVEIGSDDVSAWVHVNFISGNTNEGILVMGRAARTRIRANIIGLAPTTGSALANTACGIRVNAVDGVTIGESNDGAYNLVSGNTGCGIRLEAGADDAVVQGNRIGTDGDGEVAKLNAGGGIIVSQVLRATIGGDDVGLGNVISGNTGNGISIYGTAGINTGHIVLRNRIGLKAEEIDVLGPPELVAMVPALPDTDMRLYSRAWMAGDGVRMMLGDEPLPNTGHGIYVEDAQAVTIGNGNAFDGNIIAYNIKSGVYVTGSGAQKVSIRANSTYLNGDLGITLVAPANSTVPPTSVPPPTFSIVAFYDADAPTVHVLGSVDTAHTTCNLAPGCTVDVYRVRSTDSDDEGFEHLASQDNIGTEPFEIDVSNQVTDGDYLTVTLTDHGSTSQFQVKQRVVTPF